jgi:hypothetical protein
MHTYFIAEKKSAENSVFSDIDFTRKMVLSSCGKL